MNSGQDNALAGASLTSSIREACRLPHVALRVCSTFFADLLIGIGLTITICVTQSNAQSIYPPESAWGLFEKAERLIRDQGYNVATCSKAMPLLSSSIELWSREFETHGSEGYPQLDLGRCLLAIGETVGAMERFQYVIDHSAHFGEYIANQARVALADMYAEGHGVEQDRERALGLYMLAELSESDVQRHRDRAAAELIYTMTGGRARELFHALLERNVPSNWLRSLEVRREQNENRYDLVRLGIKALSSIKVIEGGQMEAAAFQALYLEVGQGLLAWGDPERLPAAIVCLQHADPEKARSLLETISKKLPYRLVMPDGTSWDPTHAFREHAQ